MKFTSSHSGTSRTRSGFTLVELLVATALTVLVMLLFAQIYASAVGSIRQQRSLARNDQAARAITAIVRSDLQNLTYRQPDAYHGNVRGIVPLAPGDEAIIDPENQRGYFYYSENDPNIDWDDVLQFTVQVNNSKRSSAANKGQQLPFMGRAQSLSVDNEPEQDDGLPGDGLGQSKAAEVCYFLRNGNLYRRVLLLRDPLSSSGTESDQPSNGAIPKYSLNAGTTYTTGTGRFYRDFDYAAIRNGAPPDDCLWFHSVNSLLNTQGNGNVPLAMTFTRFGFNPVNGLPVDYDSSAPTPKFFGRYTAEETSATSFRYPGQYTAATNPYGALLQSDADQNGAMDNFEDGTNIGEDIILPNVEAFNVEAWDETLGTFVSLNISIDLANLPNLDYRTGTGVATTERNIFDSWHPTANTAGRNVGTIAIPLYYPPCRFTQVSAVGNWTTAMTATASTTRIRPDGMADNGANNPPATYPPSLYYEAIQTGSSGLFKPEFPPLPGNTVQDGTVRWQCKDNRVGLQAIRITVRYRDNGNSTPRQVSIVHSFVE